MVWLCLEQT